MNYCTASVVQPTRLYFLPILVLRFLLTVPRLKKIKKNTTLTGDPSEHIPIRNNMEGAFTHVGNHLISDSAAAIKAGADDLSALDPDESLLYGKYEGGRGGHRRADDDDNQTEAFEEDDNDSLNSVPVEGMSGLKLKAVDEEKELPPHACA